MIREMTGLTKSATQGFARLGLLAVGVATFAGCDAFDRLLNVSPPSQVDASDLDDPANIGFMIAGMIGEFQCGLNSYVVLGGTAGDEFQDAASSSGQLLEVELRTWTPGGWTANTYAGWVGGCSSMSFMPLYAALSRSRWHADEILGRLDGWSDHEVVDRTAKIAEVSAYAGYNRILLGEAMCSVAFDEGPELMPDAVFSQAVDMFTRAIEAAQSVGNAEVLNMAYVGRARARLNLGQLAEAAADAQQVSEGFVKNARFSALSTDRYNKPFVLNHRNHNVSVGPLYRNFSFEGVPDPRVSVVDAQRAGSNGVVPLWLQEKHTAESSPIRLASWEEAQLILAEVEWLTGNESATVAIINELHARVGLPPFESTDRQDIWEQLIYERRAEFFLEGQHFGDLRRYAWPLHPEPGTTDFQGNVYGDQRCFPLPDIERHNNPNL